MVRCITLRLETVDANGEDYEVEGSDRDAAPGYLVLNPADRSPLLRERAVYYVRMPDGRLARAWAYVVRHMAMDHQGISLHLLDRLLQIDDRRIDVLRYIDDAGPSVCGYTVSEYPMDMARVEEEGLLAGPELQQLIADLEARRL